MLAPFELTDRRFAKAAALLLWTLGLCVMSARWTGAQSQLPANNVSGSASSTDPAPRKIRKRALLIGISKYDHGRKEDWWDLNVGRDLIAMKELLCSRPYGFEKKDILVLENQRATKQGIIAAFKKHLIAEAQAGDIYVFMFAGHGQQVIDDNGDEGDKLDESLVPYDYISQKASDGAKTNLRDDTLGELLAALGNNMRRGNRIEGNITVFLDTCFAGSATRGRQGRGRGWDRKTDEQAAPAPGAAPEANLFGEGVALSGGYVVLSAAQGNQVAQERRDNEGQQMGMFSYHLVQALLRNYESPPTYRAVFEQLRVAMAGEFRSQRPAIEGAVDKLLFDGNLAPVSNYVVVSAAGVDEVTLPLGELHGATRGSRFAIYPAGSDPMSAAKLAEVELESVSMISSTARIDAAYRGKVERTQLEAARAVEVSHLFTNRHPPLRLQLEPGLERYRRAASSAISAPTSTTYDVRLRLQENRLLLERDDETLVARIPLDKPAEVEERIKRAVQLEWRWRYLRELRNESPSARLHIKVEPILIEPLERNQLGEITRFRKRPTQLPKHDSLPTLSIGDHIGLEVCNYSERPAYVSVFELSADGDISCLYPATTALGSHNIAFTPLPPGSACPYLETPYVYALAAPEGRALIKAVATDAPSDFSGLCETQRRGGRNKASAAQEPLTRLLQPAITLRQRTARSIRTHPEEWTTSEFAYELKPTAP